MLKTAGKYSALPKTFAGLPLFFGCIGLLYANPGSAIAAPSAKEINSYASKNGFPNSLYPYYEKPNKCGGEGATSSVPDNYVIEINVPGAKPLTFSNPLGMGSVVVYRADFSHACDNHDRCYMTLANPPTVAGMVAHRKKCDVKFRADLLAACKDTAAQIGSTILSGGGNVAACILKATTYSDVVNVTGLAFFPNAQKQAKDYRDIVAKFKKEHAKSSDQITSDSNENLGGGGDQSVRLRPIPCPVDDSECFEPVDRRRLRRFHTR